MKKQAKNLQKTLVQNEKTRTITFSNQSLCFTRLWIIKNMRIINIEYINSPAQYSDFIFKNDTFYAYTFHTNIKSMSRE